MQKREIPKRIFTRKHCTSILVPSIADLVQGIYEHQFCLPPSMNIASCTVVPEQLWEFTNHISKVPLLKKGILLVSGISPRNAIKIVCCRLCPQGASGPIEERVQ